MNKIVKTTILPILTLGLLTTALWTSNVQAAEATRQTNYLLAKVGPVLTSEDLDDAGYDVGGNIALTYGRYLGRNLLIEGTLDLFAVGNDDISGTSALAGNYDIDSTMAVSSLLFTLKGELPLGRLALFGGVGGGLYGVYLENEVDSSTLGSFNKNDSDTVLGTHLTAGVTYDITERIFIGGEGLYRWTQDVKIAENVAAVPLNYRGNLNGYALTFTTGFRF